MIDPVFCYDWWDKTVVKTIDFLRVEYCCGDKKYHDYAMLIKKKFDKKLSKWVRVVLRKSKEVTENFVLTIYKPLPDTDPIEYMVP